MMKFKQNKFLTVLSAFVALFVIASMAHLAQSATTIGLNITTGGNATTTGNTILGASAWAAPTSTLSVIDGLHVFSGTATSSDAIWAGSGGTPGSIDLQGGDGFFQNDVEIAGALYLTGATTLNGAVTLGDAVGDAITVNGAITFANAATSTGNMVLGTSVWAAPTSTLTVIGGLHVFSGTATSSDAIWAGSGGTPGSIDLQGGDGFFQNDVEIAGAFYLTGASTFTGAATFNGNMTLGNAVSDTITINGATTFANAATSTGNMVLGTSVWAAPTSTLTVIGGLHVFSGTATSSNAIWVGSGGSASIDLAGGDGYFQNDVEIDGALTVAGNATSSADFVVGTESVTATTTLSIKSSAADGANGGSCIEMVDVVGNQLRIYIGAGATTLTIESGNCE